MLVPAQAAKGCKIDYEKMNPVLPSVAASFTATKQQQNDTRRTAIGGSPYCHVAIQTSALLKSAGSFFQYSTWTPASS